MRRAIVRALVAGCLTAAASSVATAQQFGTFPASYHFGVGGFLAHPDVGPSWKIRGAIVILLPRRR
jgi:hypothetical protein